MPEFSKTFTALEVLSPSSHTHIIFYFQLYVCLLYGHVHEWPGEAGGRH